MSVGGGESNSPEAPRLLFDQNLGPALIHRLVDLYPGSAHVREFGLAAANDEAVWSYAVAHGFTIVTKDDDFRQRSLLFGAPPQVIWLRLGNCRTDDVESVVRTRFIDVLAFTRDHDAALLILAHHTRATDSS